MEASGKSVSLGSQIHAFRACFSLTGGAVLNKLLARLDLQQD